MEDRTNPKEYGCELLSQIQACVYGGTGKAQARTNPQRAEEQGWSHQTRSLAPGTPCSPSPACLAAPAQLHPNGGTAPAAADFSKHPTSTCAFGFLSLGQQCPPWGLLPLPRPFFSRCCSLSPHLPHSRLPAPPLFHGIPGKATLTSRL